MLSLKEREIFGSGNFSDFSSNSSWSNFISSDYLFFIVIINNPLNNGNVETTNLRFAFNKMLLKREAYLKKELHLF